MSTSNYHLSLNLKNSLHFLLISFAAVLAFSCDGSGAQQQARRKANITTPVLETSYTYNRPDNFIDALDQTSPWVDSVFNTLTLDERIAQLIIIEAFSNRSKAYEADVMRLVKYYKVGGIIFFQGGPVRQAKLTNQYQAASKVPLLISMDAETGVGMRLDSTMQYPFQQMLGAIDDNSLIYKMGTEVAAEFKRLGMHVNFAPVADINNNPNNPIISYRAFGEDKYDVAIKSLAYMRGMQDNGILAVAKHFPGHGDTEVDSHYDLPIIPFTRSRLDSLELYPFRELIAHGVGGVMVAHMHIPNLDDTENLPSTLSKPIVTNLLRNQLNFKGLIFTDAMVMKGVTNYFSPGEAEARALMAGNDIVERLNSVPKAISAVKQAIARGDITKAEINRRCKRVLAAKQWLGLDKYKPINLEGLQRDLNTDSADSLNTALAEAAITLLRDPKNFLPLRQHRTKTIATVSFGASSPTVFQQHISDKTKTINYVISRKAKTKETTILWNKLRQHDVVLVSIYGPSIRPSNNLGYSQAATELVQKIIKSKKSVVVFFDNAYALNQFKGIEKSTVLLLAYQPHYHAQKTAANILFGHIPAQGTLPVTVSKHFKYGDGIYNAPPKNNPVTTAP